MSKSVSKIYDVLKVQNLYGVDGSGQLGGFEDEKRIKVIPWEDALKFYKSKEWTYPRPLIRHYFKTVIKQFFCKVCYLNFNVDENRKYMCIDHIIPLRTEWGWERRFDPFNEKDYSNLQMLCKKCNANKSTRFYNSKDIIKIETQRWMDETNWIGENRDKLWDKYLNLKSKQRRKKEFKEWCKFQYQNSLKV